jgi:hypothetical protein
MMPPVFPMSPIFCVLNHLVLADKHKWKGQLEQPQHQSAGILKVIHIILRNKSKSVSPFTFVEHCLPIQTKLSKPRQDFIQEKLSDTVATLTVLCEYLYTWSRRGIIVYIEYQSVCPFVWIWPPHLLQASVSPPLDPQAGLRIRIIWYGSSI